MSENKTKWYTVVMVGESNNGPMSGGACVEATSVKEAQEQCKKLCTVSAFQNLHQIIQFKPAAVFEGKLINLMEPEEEDVFLNNFDSQLRKVVDGKFN